LRNKYTVPKNESGFDILREDSDYKQRLSPAIGTRNRFTSWVKICVFVLVVLIGLKLLGVQIFIEVNFGDKTILAALTEIETYYIPLGLLLVFLVVAWLWELYFGPSDD